MGGRGYFITDIVQNYWHIVVIKSRPNFFALKLYTEKAPTYCPHPGVWTSHCSWLFSNRTVSSAKGMQKELTCLFSFLIRFFLNIIILNKIQSLRVFRSLRERESPSGWVIKKGFKEELEFSSVSNPTPALIGSSSHYHSIILSST